MVIGEIFAAIVVIFIILMLAGGTVNVLRDREQRLNRLQDEMIHDLKVAFQSNDITQFDSWLAIYGAAAPKHMKEMVANRRNEIYIDFDSNIRIEKGTENNGNLEENEPAPPTAPRLKRTSS